MTNGDHFLLNNLFPNQQLSNVSFVTVFGDTSSSNLLSHDKVSQMVTCGFGWYWLSSFPT